jgi:hypothetical protein
MTSGFRHGALLLALLGGVGLAALDQRGTDAPTDMSVASSVIRPAFVDDETTGSIDRAAIAYALSLTPKRRSRCCPRSSLKA